MAAKNTTIAVSWDILDFCNGFSIDMGGSVLKCIYIDKNEWLEPSKRKENSKGQLHLTTFNHEEFHNGTACKFIKEKALMKTGKQNKPPVICGTGFWVSSNDKTINETLGVRMQTLPETDCFISALYYTIKHLPREEVIVQIPEQVKKMTIDVLEPMKKEYAFIGQMSDKLIWTKCADTITFDPYFEEGPLKEPLAKDSDIFPCLIVMCGSGCGVMCINEDGTYSCSRVSTRAGKMWLGLGSLLTGGNNYDNLMKLAEKGSINDVSVVYSDFANVASEENKLEGDDSYQQNMDMLKEFTNKEPLPVFDFGKALNKTLDDFKKEDLARTFLQTSIADLVSTVSMTANQMNVKHVFLSGGFVSHPLVQRYVFMNFVVKDFGQRYTFPDKDGPIQCHFLKGGQHYGAFGALLNHKLQFVPVQND